MNLSPTERPASPARTGCSTGSSSAILEELTDEQTLVLESGHPLGLFPSRPDAPRVILTNALMVGMFDNPDDWEIAEQMGVANYGQMTAGGWMYIGPAGESSTARSIRFSVWGRKYLGVPSDGDLTGKVFVSSGLGGMSGAQPKAANIARAVGVFAEVDAFPHSDPARSGLGG